MQDKELKFWTTTPNVFFVAKSTESGRILGCISYKQYTPDTVEICRLTVDKEFRGLKIGLKLFQFLLNTAKENGYNTVYLETAEPNMKARKLYEKNGFKYLHSLPYLHMVVLGIRFDFLCGFKEAAYIKRIQ